MAGVLALLAYANAADEDRHKYPKYTHGFVDHDGTPRFYLRVPGRKRVPLPGLPWSPEFMEAREKALKDDWVAPELGASHTKAGTVNGCLGLLLSIERLPGRLGRKFAANAPSNPGTVPRRAWREADCAPA
jgi:hypothetical protein